MEVVSNVVVSNVVVSVATTRETVVGVVAVVDQDVVTSRIRAETSRTKVSVRVVRVVVGVMTTKMKFHFDRRYMKTP